VAGQPGINPVHHSPAERQADWRLLARYRLCQSKEPLHLVATRGARHPLGVGDRRRGIGEPDPIPRSRPERQNG
jgi:hypothetical protein